MVEKHRSLPSKPKLEDFLEFGTEIVSFVTNLLDECIWAPNGCQGERRNGAPSHLKSICDFCRPRLKEHLKPALADTPSCARTHTHNSSYHCSSSRWSTEHLLPLVTGSDSAHLILPTAFLESYTATMQSSCLAICCSQPSTRRALGNPKPEALQPFKSSTLSSPFPRRSPAPIQGPPAVGIKIFPASASSQSKRVALKPKAPGAASSQIASYW